MNMSKINDGVEQVHCADCQKVIYLKDTISVGGNSDVICFSCNDDRLLNDYTLCSECQRSSHPDDTIYQGGNAYCFDCYNELICDEFDVNEYLTLKRVGDKTLTYVNGKEVSQCMYLLMNIPKREAEDEGCINIDEFKSKYSTGLERNSKSHIISPETEFWGHCSNIQAWVETDYNPNVLHSSISVPLLRELALCERKVFDSLLYHLDEMWKAYRTKERRIFVYNKYAEIIIMGVEKFNIDLEEIDSLFISVIWDVAIFNRFGKTFKHMRTVINKHISKILLRDL